MHHPDKYWIVRSLVNEFIDYYTMGGAEDIIWSRKTEYEFLPSGTKTDHDAGMISKVSRLHDDSPNLAIISRVLQALPVEQFHAIVAFYRFVGLDDNDKAYTEQDKAVKVGQNRDEFRENVYKAKREIYRRLTTERREVA